MPVRQNDTETLDGVLIHDGECPFCSAAATVLRRLPRVGTIEWDDSAAQRFLATQFCEPPFAVVFVDATEERVYVGRDAAVELCDRAGVPALIQDIVDESYERAADAIRTTAGVDREANQYHDTLALADAARTPLDTLLEAARPAPFVLTV